MGNIFSIVAGGIQAGTDIYAGQVSKDAAYQAAKEDERAGTAEFAAAQREGFERQLEGDLLASSQQAQAAASGGGAAADAPTILKLMGDTAKRTQYGVETAIYGGKEKQAKYFSQADVRRKSGDASFIGGVLSGVGDFAGGFA